MGGYVSSYNNCGGPANDHAGEQLGERFLIVRELVAKLPEILELWEKLEGFNDLSALLDLKVDKASGGIANGYAPLNPQTLISAVFLPGGSVQDHAAAADPHVQYLTQIRGDARYAQVGIDGRITAAQLPAFVDDVLEFPTLADFPLPGEKGKLYVTDSEDPALGNKTYRWTGTQYFPVGDGNGFGNLGSTDALVEGTVNFYHTGARVRGTALTGLAIGAGGSIVAGDTVIVAFGKLQQSINDVVGALGGKANQSDLTVLAQSVSGKADASHGHVIANITGLQGALDSKQTKITSGTGNPSGGADGDVYFKVS
jgi:hypothetical protein